jgi:hypothetical protein
MRKLLKIVALVVLAVVGLLLAGGGLFAVEVFSRKPLKAVPSTTAAALGRKTCIDCHAPIAAEWRQSVHYKSVTGAYWQEAKQLGYLKLYENVRKPCLNCHAPANVLDLAASAPGTELGVECTPNLFREPQGTIPLARSDDVALGVDCTACHVSAHGIAGAGHRPTAQHATIADRRFQDPLLTSDALCGPCHRATVNAWKATKLAADGVTCLDCHMPRVSAPSVAGGVPRLRRSHLFAADKNDAMLGRAVNASFDIDGGHARLRITNDRVGHYFPSGANWIIVKFKASDRAGRPLREEQAAFGRKEDPFLDFWPFNGDERIAFGDHKDIDFALPPGHGTVEAAIRYHDWMHTEKTVVTLKREF